MWCLISTYFPGPSIQPTNIFGLLGCCSIKFSQTAGDRPIGFQTYSPPEKGQSAKLGNKSPTACCDWRCLRVQRVIKLLVFSNFRGFPRSPRRSTGRILHRAMPSWQRRLNGLYPMTCQQPTTLVPWKLQIGHPFLCILWNGKVSKYLGVVQLVQFRVSSIIPRDWHLQP